MCNVLKIAKNGFSEHKASSLIDWLSITRSQGVTVFLTVHLEIFTSSQDSSVRTTKEELVAGFAILNLQEL